MQKKGNRVQITCDWCGKTKELKHWSDAHGKIFQSCSVECKNNLQKVYMKKKWASLTPEQRAEWEAKLVNNRPNDGKGFIDYYKKSRPERVRKVIELMTSPIGEHLPNQRYVTRSDRRKRRGTDKEGVIKINPRLDGDEWLPRGTCTLIAAHHEMLKHDPERLTTEFMEKICGVDCKCKVKKEEQT